jgi:hypothetical protein
MVPGGEVGGLVAGAERMLLGHSLSLTQPVSSFVAGRHRRRGKARPPELPAFPSPFLYLPVLRWIANLVVEFVVPFWSTPFPMPLHYIWIADSSEQ